MEHPVIIGSVGERLVEAELLKQGFYVAKPSIDVSGYDLLAGVTPNFYHRLQIKTSRVPVVTEGKPAGYRFTSFASRAADFCIFVCLMHNTYYVVPMEKVSSGIKITGDGSGTSKYEKYFSAWHILKNGTDKKQSPQVIDNK